MASKKSKVLAIAFCAAVMAGIHVNPVLAYNPGKFDTDTHVEALLMLTKKLVKSQ